MAENNDEKLSQQNISEDPSSNGCNNIDKSALENDPKKDGELENVIDIAENLNNETNTESVFETSSLLAEKRTKIDFSNLKNYNFDKFEGSPSENVVNYPKIDEFPADVSIRDFKSLDAIENDLFNNDDIEENGNAKFVRSLNAATTSKVGRRGRTKYGRSKSWCPRSGEEGLSTADVRLLRERLLRTQSHPQPTAIRNFTREQRLTLGSLALVDFMSFCSMSIMAPFFPREAAEKGMTYSLSGFVFSFYALIMFVTSPFFGKILPTVGAKFLLLSGIFVAGSCNLLFGCLEYIYDYETFTTFCFIIRGFEALGASAYSTASYVFVVNSFPNNIGSVLGILETFIGLGMSVGPAIGGLLYTVGGFGLPFYVLGVSMVITLPINYFLLPNQEDNSVCSQTGSLLELVKVPGIVITGLVIVVVSNTWSFLDPTLEPHLSQFNLSAEQVGLIFLLFSGLYGLFSPVWGYLADRITRHWCMMVWGLLLCTVGLLMLGPSPLIPFLESSLWLNLLGLSIIGISVALTLLPTFQGVLTSSIEEGGCSDNLSTYSIVAGVWSCMYSLGEVTGPSLGGVLLKNFGFPICSTVMAGFTFVLALIVLLFYSIKETSKLSSDASDTFSYNATSDSWQVPGSLEEEQLLSSSNSSGEPSKPRVRQSYGGTGISTDNGKEYTLNHVEGETTKSTGNHIKLKSLFSSKTKSQTSHQEETEGSTVRGLRALVQSDFYQKYLDESLVKVDLNSIDKSYKDNPFTFDRKYKSEDVNKKRKGNMEKFDRNSSDDLMKYNRDKVKYYNQSRQDECEDLILDRHQVTDVRGTVNITSGGACEV